MRSVKIPLIQVRIAQRQGVEYFLWRVVEERIECKVNIETFTRADAIERPLGIMISAVTEGF